MTSRAHRAHIEQGRMPPSAFPWERLLWLLAGAAALIVVAGLAGCDRESVAVAGRTRVSRTELETYLSRRSRAASGDASVALGELGQRALLAEAGRKAGLEKDPAVEARLAASRREILAQAYLDRELAAADREDALRKRYATEKDALTRRRIHVAHIVFRVREGQHGAREAALSRATRAYARLAGGEPFETVAKEASEDPATGAKGGELGPLLEGEVDKGFFEAAAAVGRGDFSRPIETPYGFHVIKALDPVEKVTPTFEDVRATLSAEARAEAQTRLLEGLQRDIGVELHPERVRTAAKPTADHRGEGK